MFRDVSKYSYTPQELSRTYRDADIPKYKLSIDGFFEISNSAADIFASSPRPQYLRIAPRPKNKTLFTLPGLGDNLVIRQTSKILSKFLGVQFFSREDEIRQLCSIIRTEPKAKILRTDIKSFFESVRFEKCIEMLREAGFNNQSALKHLEAIKSASEAAGIFGLPRGLSISSLLAELFMQKFDKKMRSIQSCCYYCRYVDDILVVATNENVNISSAINDALNEIGLIMNPTKTDEVEVGSSKYLDFLGYSINLSNPSIIKIAESKINKTKKRIALAIKEYSSTRDHEMFRRRLSFLTSNTIMRMTGRSKPLIIGFRYSYALASHTQTLDQMAELDKFLHGMLGSKRYYISKKIRTFCTKSDLQSFHQFSFRRSYDIAHAEYRSSVEIAKITEAWAHV